MLMHIGSTEEITLIEFNEEEEGDQQETPQAIEEKRSRLLKSSLSAQITTPPLSSKANPRAF